MTKRNISWIAIVALLICAAVPMLVFAQFTPEVFTIDQNVVDGTVNVTRATMNGDGWVVIHADDGGAPGPVLGYAPVADGVNANIKVDIDSDAATDTLYAMLHVDAGEAGTYEFPGADEPLTENGEVVMTPFAVTGKIQTVVGVAQEAGGFDTLLAAIDAAGLTKSLMAEDGAFTVFAPTDDAFAALPEGTVDSLLADTETLNQVLTYHVLPQVVMADDISDGMEAATMQGDVVTFTVSSDVVMINDAAITAADITADNGVIHVIDAVILPSAVAEALGASGAEEAAAASEEEETPEPVQSITVERQETDGSSVTVGSVEAAQDSWVAVRTNDAFQPGDVLGYAAVPAGVSENVMVDLAEPLTESGMYFVSLHADDGEAGAFEYPDADPVVMYMQSPVEEPVQLVVGEMTAAEEAEATPEPTEEAAAAPECMDIVDTAINADGFGTLVTAVQAAGLVDTLKSEGPFTVFAPADEAFAALPDGTLDALLEDPEGALKEVLLYHVIPDKLMAEDIAKMGSSVTAQGQSVTFTVGGNNIMVNDANVVAADIEACNGVIHVIDKVIIPAASEDAMAEAETTEAEMTPEATEEAVEEAAEATPEPTEEAMEEAVEATPEPTEEAMAEETMADAAAGTVPGTVPGTLPETGASLPTAATTIPTLVLVGIALTGAAYVTRRREE